MTTRTAATNARSVTGTGSVPAPCRAQVPRALANPAVASLLVRLWRGLPSALDAALEIGCGPGNHLGALLPPLAIRRFFKIDSDPDAVARARQVHRDMGLASVTIEQGDATHLDAHPDESLDLVLAQAVTDQIADSRAMVRELHRVLKPGGFFLEINDLTMNVPGFIGQQVAEGRQTDGSLDVLVPNPSRSPTGDDDYLTIRYDELCAAAGAGITQSAFDRVLLPYLRGLPRFWALFARDPDDASVELVADTVEALARAGAPLRPFATRRHLVNRCDALFGGPRTSLEMVENTLFQIENVVPLADLPPGLAGPGGEATVPGAPVQVPRSGLRQLADHLTGGSAWQRHRRRGLVRSRAGGPKAVIPPSHP